VVSLRVATISSVPLRRRRKASDSRCKPFGTDAPTGYGSAPPSGRFEGQGRLADESISVADRQRPHPPVLAQADFGCGHRPALGKTEALILSLQGVCSHGLEIPVMDSLSVDNQKKDKR